MSRWTAGDLKTLWPGVTATINSPAAARTAPPVDSTGTVDGNGSAAITVEPLRSFSLILPWPPTGNHGTKHTKTGKHYLTQAHRTYRSEVAHYVQQGRVLTIRGKYRMSVVCHPPDRRKRDFDNVQKTFCDALQHAKAIADDCYMRQLVVLWHDWSRSEPARIVVDVAELTQ